MERSSPIARHRLTIDKSLRAGELARRAGLAEVRVLARLRSTNVRAAEMVEGGGLKLPAAIVAARQSAGRGRGGHAWYADAGSLAVTFVLPVQTSRPLTELPLLVGLAVRAALGRYVSPSLLQIKWPNDLLAGGKKIAGILCERRGAADLIGIGVNVTTSLRGAPADVRRRATTIARLTRRPPSRAEVFTQLALALREVWLMENWCEEINRVHALTGQTIAIDTGDGILTGLCTGIDTQGRLLVNDGRRTHRILNGTILAH